MLHGQPAYMRLVDDGVMPWHTRRAVVSPGEGRVDDAGLRCSRGAVAFIEREILPGMSEPVTEMRITPGQGALQVLRVGLDQQLVWIEAQPAPGIVWTIHAVAIQQ